MDVENSAVLLLVCHSLDSGRFIISGYGDEALMANFIIREHGSTR